MQLVKKLTTAAVTGALFLNIAAPVLAGSTITINNSSNGRGSENEAEVELKNNIYVTQENYTKVKNDVDQEGETGENKVQDNIGGDIKVDTGKVEQVAKIMTEAGLNMAEVQDCGCDYEIEIINEKNGRDSENEGEVEIESTKMLDQYNKTKVKNYVDQEGETGENKVKDNIDGNVDVKTGLVDQLANIATSAGMNKAMVGDGDGGTTDLTLKNLMNGRDSENEAEVELERFLYVDQDNKAKVKNDVDQEGETGENKVKDNLGGVELETGKVDQVAKIMNLLGSNALQASACCELDVELINDKNGRDSENEIEVELDHEMMLAQLNKQKVKNDADQEGETGENKIKDNNSDDLNTGDVDSNVEITTEAGINVLGDVDWDEMDFDSSLSLILLLIEILL